MSPRGRRRAIVLANGRQLRVRGLDKLAGLAAQRQDPPGPAPTIDLQWPSRTAVRLSRADGTGLRLRYRELAAGLGATARTQLAEHPAATAEFLADVVTDAPRQG